MTNSGDSLPCVAHLLRPAQGGMRELVRTLLRRAATAGTPSLLLAPQETLDTLSDVVPDPAQQYVLRTDSVAPQHQIAAGQMAGKWAKRAGARAVTRAWPAIRPPVHVCLAHVGTTAGGQPA